MAKKDMKKHEEFEVSDKSLEKVSGGASGTKKYFDEFGDVITVQWDEDDLIKANSLGLTLDDYLDTIVYGKPYQQTSK